MVLEKVDMIDAETFERLVYLPGGFFPRAPVYLRHEEGLTAITIFQSLSKPNFAFPQRCSPMRCP